jgi:4'-phosphopantetheinyl transferase EntD
MATILFSAKEAFYKCQYTLTRKWLEFEDVSVETTWDEFQISARGEAASGIAGGKSLCGKFVIDGDRVVCGIAIHPRL